MSTGPKVMSHNFPNMSLGSAQSPLPEKAEITLWHHFLALLPRGPICLLQSLAITLCPDTIFRCPQGKRFPPLLLDLSELGGHHKWKSPKRGLMVWFKEPKRGRRGSQRNTRPMSYIYVFPYLTHITVQCQAQFSLHPQMHTSIIHLTLWTPGGQKRPASIYFILCKFSSTMNGKHWIRSVAQE